MSPVANMMIHNPITALAGDAQEMRKTAKHFGYYERDNN